MVLTLSAANRGREKRNSLVPSLSTNPVMILGKKKHAVSVIKTEGLGERGVNTSVVQHSECV